MAGGSEAHMRERFVCSTRHQAGRRAASIIYVMTELATAITAVLPEVVGGVYSGTSTVAKRTNVRLGSDRIGEVSCGRSGSEAPSL